jgi:methionyl-tRNA formyltransferase
MIGMYLMTEKGYKVLNSIISKQRANKISHVISSRDKNVQKDYFEEIAELCAANGIPFHERSDNLQLSSEYTIAISWRWIIPVQQNLIILHDSLLPRYRGFAPLVSYLINGEKEIGVTALFAQEEYDTGDIICQKSVTISYPIKIKEAIAKIADVYVEVLDEVMDRIINDKNLAAIPQNDSGASYCLWLEENDYRINWEKSAGEIKRFIDAVGFPFKGASASISGKLVRILHAGIMDDVRIENRVPGKVIFIRNNKPVVVCGKGLLLIEEMIWDSEQTNALPLKHLRTRFS